MKPSIPNHLQSTCRLLDCAYPAGVSGDEYMALLVLLYEHLSDRNLAQAIAHVFHLEETLVSNDIARSRMHEADRQTLIEVMARLNACNFSAWINEEAATTLQR